jgi:hypothetical protein
VTTSPLKIFIIVSSNLHYFIIFCVNWSILILLIVYKKTRQLVKKKIEITTHNLELLKYSISIGTLGAYRSQNYCSQND